MLHLKAFLQVPGEPCLPALLEHQLRHGHVLPLNLDGTQACRYHPRLLVLRLHPRAHRARAGTLLVVANLLPHHQLADPLRLVSLHWARFHPRRLIGWMMNGLVDSAQPGHLPAGERPLMRILPLTGLTLLKTPLRPARG